MRLRLVQTNPTHLRLLLRSNPATSPSDRTGSCISPILDDNRFFGDCQMGILKLSPERASLAILAMEVGRLKQNSTILEAWRSLGTELSTSFSQAGPKFPGEF